MYTTRPLTRALVALGLVAVLSGYGLAAQQGNYGMMEDEPSARQQPTEQRAYSPATEVTIRRATQLIGQPVRNAQGETLGTIYDLVLTPDLDQVSYVVLTRGGVFGIGNNLYAIPWSAMRLGTGGSYLAPISAEELTQWRGFRSSAWPTDPSRSWAERSERALDEPQTAETNRSVQLRRVSRVRGFMVKTPEGLDAGNIQDMAIAMDSGRILYTIVSFGGFFGVGQQYAAVPQGAINLQPDQRVAQLTVSRSVLEENAFAAGQYPDLGDPAYARSINEAFGTEPGPDWIVLGFVPAEGRKPQEGQPLTADMLEPSTTEYADLFGPSVVKTIEGTITDIGLFDVGATRLEGLRLRVKTATGETVTVYAGPRDYVSKQDFYAVNGDRISATGVSVRRGWRSIFLATRITRDGKTLELRDEGGRPLWVEKGQLPEATSPSRERAPEGSSEEMAETPGR